MKKLMSLFAATSLSLLALTGQSRADEVDITEALQQTTDIEQVAHDIALGNASNGHLAEAKLRWTPGEETLTIWGKLRLHNKHQQCVNTPFGRKCWDTYNYWVNVRFEARLENCRVVGIDLSSENELYKVPAALGDLLGSVINAARGGTVLSGMPGCQ